MMLSSILAVLLLAALLYGRVPLLLLLSVCGLLLAALLWNRARHRHSHTRGQSLQIDLVAQNSRIAHWSAGLKVGTSMVFLLTCLAADSIPVAVIIAVCMTAVNLAASRMGVGAYVSLLLVPATFVIVSGLVLVAEIAAQPLGFLDIPLGGVFLRITPESQTATALVMAKALAALSCLYGLSLSTPVYEITAVLRRMRLPAIVVELMVLIYRYIFILLASLNSMTTAAQARLGYKDYRSAWRSFTGIGTNLLARSFAQASRSFSAMEARCYDGEMQFLEQEKPVKAAHVMVSTGLLAAFVAVKILERGFL